MTGRDKEILVEKALEARRFSYVPYSGFRVGAALLAKDGRIITGCNIENASYTPTNCAERTAVFKAVSEGILDFEAIAIAGGPGLEPPGDFAPPCGVCRQALAEFCDLETFRVYLAAPGGGVEETTLGALLPRAFARANLDKS